MKRNSIMKTTYFILLASFIYNETVELLSRVQGAPGYSDIYVSGALVFPFNILATLVLIIMFLRDSEKEAKVKTFATSLCVVNLFAIFATNFFYNQARRTFVFGLLGPEYKLGFLSTLLSVVCFVLLFKLIFIKEKETKKISLNV